MGRKPRRTAEPPPSAEMVSPFEPPPPPEPSEPLPPSSDDGEPSAELTIPAGQAAQVKPANLPAAFARNQQIEAQPSTVLVVPRMTIPKMRYGPKWYSFQKGKKVSVPPEVRDHLKRKGIL